MFSHVCEDTVHSLRSISFASNAFIKGTLLLAAKCSQNGNRAISLAMIQYAFWATQLRKSILVKHFFAKNTKNGKKNKLKFVFLRRSPTRHHSFRPHLPIRRSQTLQKYTLGSTFLSYPPLPSSSSSVSSRFSLFSTPP